MKKSLLGAAMVAAAFSIAVSAGGVALAKGPVVPVPGRLVITGPGLGPPITLQGKVFPQEYGWEGSGARSSELTTELRDLGLLEAGPEVGWYVLSPDTSTLGPGYAIREYVSDGKGLDSTVSTKATLYPYASNRPLVFTTTESRFSGSKGLWWSAPPRLRSWLVAHGLPSTPLSLAPAIRPAISRQPLPAARAPGLSGWEWLFVLGSLAGLLVLGVQAGRPRRARIPLGR